MSDRTTRTPDAALDPDETLHLDGCYLPGDHDGPCRACAACDGDPEALGRHVCGRPDYA